MSAKVWFWSADGTENAEPYASLGAAQEGLERKLEAHRNKGHDVEFKVGGEAGDPLWIVEHEGVILAKYRVIM